MSTAPAPRLPRLLTIMGSGETAPTMVRVHRQLLERLGPRPVPAVLLDTPFGFQENADDIVRRAREYFRESLQTDIELASFRSAGGVDPAARAAWLAQVQSARYVFAGPGSPSYALRQWESSGLAGELREKLTTGGAVTFASAAALTLGTATIPVYEIYKVGEDPHWLAGLDLLASTGLRAVVVPHYNNSEGGNHDTRFCYLGERRLSVMEGQLDPGTFVLGVDEHTGLVMDLDAGEARVAGLGVVTVRARGRSQQIGTGSTVPIADLAERAADLAAGRGTFRGVGGTGADGGGAGGAERAGEPGGAGAGGGEPGGGAAGGGEPGGGAAGGGAAGGGAAGGRPPAAAPLATSPLLATVRDRQASFAGAVGHRDAAGAVRAVLELDGDLLAWSRDTLQSDELDRGRDALHAMVASLGQLAAGGIGDPRDTVGPFVEALLDERARARAERRFGDADRVRDALVALGVEVRDTSEGTEWLLAGG